MPSTEPNRYIVKEEYDGSRLDRWFRKNVENVPQSVIEKLARSGKIKLNNQKIKTNIRVSASDVIEIAKDIAVSDKNIADRTIDPYYVELIRNSIIYNDNNILALNKPSNFAVQGGSKIDISVDDILPYIAEPGQRLRLVHRLDKATSGILIIAKDNRVAQTLGEAFQDRRIKKTYRAILTNTPNKDTGMVKVNMRKQGGVNKEKMVVSEDGDLSITRYKVLQLLKNNHCLVEFYPITGRTHQLRLHAQYLNSPILGDSKYGDNSRAREKNLYLHASVIEINDIFNKSIKIEGEPPVYFKNRLQDLE